MAKKGARSQDWPKTPPFSMTFRKFWKISGRKRDLFCRFFIFQGGYPGFWAKSVKKSILGGLWGASTPHFRPEMAFFAWNGQKWPKISDFGGLGGLDPPFSGPLRPISAPPLWGGIMAWKWPHFAFKYVQNRGHFTPEIDRSALKMLSFYPKIPEIWLPQTQKWLFSFPITQ